MRNIVWSLIARVVSRPAVADWIIERSKRKPYYPITSRDGAEIYMDRHWLFNPYTKDADGNAGPARLSWLPSIRVHHIMRADDDGHMHDHPWNARTIVLRGWYREERPWLVGDVVPKNCTKLIFSHADDRMELTRTTGYTGRVLFDSYHRISSVSNGGVTTLWFTWRYRGTWGFLVGSKKVPWREYLNVPKGML